MAFVDPTKLSIKRKAHFACCVCHAIGVEIHHIIPQAEGGSDTEDNGAPLCPSCHETYGANSTKRKFIREARDHWYELCAVRYASDASRLEALHELLQQLPTRTDIGEMIAKASSGGGYPAPIESNGTDEPQPGEDLLSQPISQAAVEAYLRWMYRPLIHCSDDMTASLCSTVRGAGYNTIGELHSVLGRTRGVVEDFVNESRDDGAKMDHILDANIAQLFLGIFDEQYCRMNYPKTYAKFAGSPHWIRPSIHSASG